MLRSNFLNGVCTVAAVVPLMGQIPSVPKSIAGIAIPDSAMAKEAASVAAAEPPAIFNHSLRTFLFAELVARAQRIDHDVEAVYVASILHDTGLVPAFMSETERFEVDGANLSRKLLARFGVLGPRADLVWDAVCLHDQGDIAKWKQPEVMLVSAGVGADFGAHASILNRADIASVLAAAPRAGFIPVFLDTVAAFVKRKPDATGNSWVTDVGYRMVPHFHVDNFVDEVKDDPFAGIAP